MAWKNLVSSPWFGGIGLVSLVLGIPGMPEDAAEWRTWLSAMSAEWQGALIGAGAVMVLLFVGTNIVRLLPSIRARKLRWESFDIPIREAVDHYVRTFPHSYKDGADRHAFEVLHKAMCNGKLPVVGAKGEESPSELIAAQRCKRLKPRMVLVPKNWASPQGVRFDLFENVGPSQPLEESDGLSVYTGLRVRSTDLYGLWPKDARTEDG